MMERIINRAVVYYHNQYAQKYRKYFARCGTNTLVHHSFYIGCPEQIYLGNDVTILANSRLQLFPKLVKAKKKIEIGDRCFIGFHFTILAGDDVVLGNDITIASNVSIFSHNHGMNPEAGISYGEQELICAPVTIKDGCFIGQNAVICPGVTIGKKCVIGAGAVVTRSIPDYCKAVGNPARILSEYNFEQNKWLRMGGGKRIGSLFCLLYSPCMFSPTLQMTA